MLVILTLQHAWPSWSLSIPYICLEMNTRLTNGGDFKQNITIKCGWNATKILNAKVIIVQIFQFRTNMCNKWHSLEIIYYIQHKRNVSNGILGIIVSRDIEGIPSSLDELHKSMNKDWRSRCFGTTSCLISIRCGTTFVINVIVYSAKIIFWKLFGRFFVTILNLPPFTFHSKLKSPKTGTW